MLIHSLVPDSKEFGQFQLGMLVSRFLLKSFPQRNLRQPVIMGSENQTIRNTAIFDVDKFTKQIIYI